MKILVCLKAVYDIEPLTQDEWQEIVRDGMDFGCVRKQLSCFDEAALELGLRLTDELEAAGQSHDLTAVTIDPAGDVDTLLKGLYAVKFDRVCKLVPPDSGAIAPFGVATLLADFVRQNGGYDLILMGQQSVGADSGQTHWMLSELLGIPAVTHLCALGLQPDGLLVRHRRERFLAEALLKMPVILGVENTEFPYLRLATLREKMASAKRQIEVLPAAQPATGPEPDSIRHDKQSRQGVLLEGETAADKVRQLMERIAGEVGGR